MSIITTFKSKDDLHHGKGSSIDVISECEMSLGLQFSKEYKEYLKEFSTVYYDGHELTGISNSKHINVVEVTLNERILNPNVPLDLYVIERHDEVITWQDKNGTIYQTTPTSVPKIIFASLENYINR